MLNAADKVAFQKIIAATVEAKNRTEKKI